MNYTQEQEEHAKTILIYLIGAPAFIASDQTENIETLLAIIGPRDIQRAQSFQRTLSLKNDRIHFLESIRKTYPDSIRTFIQDIASGDFDCTLCPRAQKLLTHLDDPPTVTIR